MGGEGGGGGGGGVGGGGGGRACIEGPEILLLLRNYKQVVVWALRVVGWQEWCGW